jgi:hypothetical protein
LLHAYNLEVVALYLPIPVFHCLRKIETSTLDRTATEGTPMARKGGERG